MAKPSKTPRHFCFLATVAAYGTLAIAGVPHEFKTGDKASAQQVMDNFHYIDSMSTVLKAELQKAQAALIDQGIDLKSLKADIITKTDSVFVTSLLHTSISQKLDTADANHRFIESVSPNGFTFSKGNSTTDIQLNWNPGSNGNLAIKIPSPGSPPSYLIGFGDYATNGGGFYIGDGYSVSGLFMDEDGLIIGSRGRIHSNAIIIQDQNAIFPGNLSFESGFKSHSKSTTQDLEVQGILTVQSKQIAPDYVFEPNYPLMPLPDVARFVQTNKHLPEIPDAAHIASQGMDVGTMNLLLLKKVEELTLHLIDQNRRIDSLQAAMQTH